ncbi:hypothetical protein QCA50_017314 [Cerrena zonata]|uniref:Uncharacterized protein n=1 Tax=Cerrena zonata TaxID=2478898 RepID=A0AAW0FFB5_9APHY
MCCRRHICYIYTQCGHAYSMPEENVSLVTIHAAGLAPLIPPHAMVLLARQTVGNIANLLNNTPPK